MSGSQKKVAIDRIVETAIFLQAESRRLAKEQCARAGITATQLNVLKLLQEIGDLSLSQISGHLAANNSTVTGIIDRMVDADLVAREKDPRDRRVTKIRMTDRGADIAASIEVAPWDLLRSALRALPAAEIDRLIEILEKLAAHVERHAADANPKQERARG